MHPAYETYWKRKELLRRSWPEFPVRRWWETEGLCDIERAYFEAIRDAPSLLDVGAGDLRIMHKIQAAGYSGEYHTHDVGPEGSYTYRDLAEVKRSYSAVLCLDVIEHLSLEDGLGLVKRLISVTAPRGVLILQTANAAYIPDPRSWDMTHLHTYNIQDLWAYLTCEGFDVAGYRVLFAEPRAGVATRFRRSIVRYAKKKILGCDFANNIVVIARKP